MDGIFIDFYDDTCDSDTNRPHEHLPFYPIMASHIKFIKKLFLWCEANGKVLFLNAVHPSIPVLHLCHGQFGDTMGVSGNMGLSDRLVTAAAGKPYRLLPYYGQGAPGGLTADRWRLGANGWSERTKCFECFFRQL